MKLRRRRTLMVTTILGIILFTEVLVGQILFPNLTFINGNWTITNRIVGYLTFSGFIFLFVTLFNSSKMLLIPLGIILFIIFFVNSCAEIYPLDTTTQPKDIAVIQRGEDRRKLIVRERMNVKTNTIINDTVWVQDNFIFRQILIPKDN